MMFVNEKLQEFERYIRNKRVALIELDDSSIPLIDYFIEKGASVTVFDKRNIDEMDKSIIDKVNSRSINFSFGEHNLINLVGFDLIFRSPAYRDDIPELRAESLRGAIITSELEMLIEMCPGKVIGVAGNEGKTTTASLIYEIVKEKGYECYICENNITPLFTKIGEMKPNCVVVLELNSTQLMGIQSSPEIAVITNISQEYPNIHETFEEYVECIKNIFKHQENDGKLIINYDDNITNGFAREANGTVRFFSSKTKLDDGVIYDDNVIKSCEEGIRMHIMTIDDAISIYGIHNYANICAAIAATEEFIDPYTQSRAITKFKGVEHRLELVRNINNVRWYNDSIGTTPTRTVSSLNAFREKIVLIIGGNDKNSDYDCILRPIIRKASKLILTGTVADKIEEPIKEILRNSSKDLQIYKCDTLEECVKKANEIAESDEVVLFSPASANFEIDKNYDEVGREFKELVNSLENIN